MADELEGRATGSGPTGPLVPVLPLNVNRNSMAGSPLSVLIRSHVGVLITNLLFSIFKNWSII